MGLVPIKILKSNVSCVSLPLMPEAETRTENSVTDSRKHSSKLNRLAIRSHSAWPGNNTDQPTVYT